MANCLPSSRSLTPLNNFIRHLAGIQNCMYFFFKKFLYNFTLKNKMTLWSCRKQNDSTVHYRDAHLVAWKPQVALQHAICGSSEVKWHSKDRVSSITENVPCHMQWALSRVDALSLTNSKTVGGAGTWVGMWWWHCHQCHYFTTT